ncbi:lipopolysaccharide biosynthesis protein [Undibacterium sp. SXout11W]|uniref:lipopolysaccharide biosynthesis protein n=1 Tax=Undibacterium sp. SXout11W TaxID=3413050 RepID=UPI003BF15227
MSRSIGKLIKAIDLQSIASLYLGKMSGVLVAFLFLPWYSRLLGPSQFGLVAIVISLQSLLMMLDLGMSTVVGREVAAGQLRVKEIIRLVLVAERALIGFYLILLFGLCVWIAAGGLENIKFFTAIECVVLFCLLVIQNVYYSAMLAKSEYKSATRIQATWVMIRAACSLLVLKYISPTFDSFIFVQLVVSTLHCIVSRNVTCRLLSGCVKTSEIDKITIFDCWALVKKGRSLLISGIAGAFAMQLDKPIISFFMAARDVSPYFLAVTLSSAPIGILATPIVQFFQPKIINDIAQKNTSSYKKNLKNFAFALGLFGLAPAFVLYFFNAQIVHVWLSASDLSPIVTTYSKILVIGYIISAIGYIPFVLLIAYGEYRFQANVSIFSTALVLLLTIFYARQKNIEMVCYAYVLYFSLVTVTFFFRVKIWKRVVSR